MSSGTFPSGYIRSGLLLIQGCYLVCAKIKILLFHIDGLLLDGEGRKVDQGVSCWLIKLSFDCQVLLPLGVAVTIIMILLLLLCVICVCFYATSPLAFSY